MPETRDAPRRGRPVDPGVDPALRTATFAVLQEHGWRGTTIERISERAGVARTTVYRRHGSVYGVMIMLLDDVWVPDPPVDTGTLRGDLVSTARAVHRLWTDPNSLNYLCAMTVARRENADVAAALRVRGEADRAAERPIVERAQARGELRAGADADLLIDLVRSIIVRRAMHRDPAVPADFPERVVDAVLTGFSP